MEAKRKSIFINTSDHANGGLNEEKEYYLYKVLERVPCKESITFLRHIPTWHPLSGNVGTNFADKRRSLGRYSSLADLGHGVLFLVFHTRSSKPGGFLLRFQCYYD
jgi:hypothetical protein